MWAPSGDGTCFSGHSLPALGAPICLRYTYVFTARYRSVGLRISSSLFHATTVNSSFTVSTSIKKFFCHHSPKSSLIDSLHPVEQSHSFPSRLFDGSRLHLCKQVSGYALGTRPHAIAMDIILEVADTLLFDRIYSTLFPASPSQYITQKYNNITSSTFSSVREGAVPSPQFTYIFEPASQIINLQPTHWAYSSSLPRDNIYRQGVSLFMIVW